MTTISVEGQISELRGDFNDLRDQFGELRGEVGELKGEVRGLSKRMDDMHRLLMILIGVAGGGLLTAVSGLIVQLIK